MNITPPCRGAIRECRTGSLHRLPNQSHKLPDVIFRRIERRHETSLGRFLVPNIEEISFLKRSHISPGHDRKDAVGLNFLRELYPGNLSQLGCQDPGHLISMRGVLTPKVISEQRLKLR